MLEIQWMRNFPFKNQRVGQTKHRDAGVLRLPVGPLAEFKGLVQL